MYFFFLEYLHDQNKNFSMTYYTDLSDLSAGLWISGYQKFDLNLRSELGVSTKYKSHTNI